MMKKSTRRGSSSMSSSRHLEGVGRPGHETSRRRSTRSQICPTCLESLSAVSMQHVWARVHCTRTYATLLDPLSPRRALVLPWRSLRRQRLLEVGLWRRPRVRHLRQVRLHYGKQCHGAPYSVEPGAAALGCRPGRTLALLVRAVLVHWDGSASGEEGSGHWAACRWQSTLALGSASQRFPSVTLTAVGSLLLWSTEMG